MTLNEALEQLEALGNEKRRAQTPGRSPFAPIWINAMVSRSMD